MSVTIVTGNATFPSNLSLYSVIAPPEESEPPNTTSSPTTPYEGYEAALISIFAGIIAFVTIIGNIMVYMVDIDTQ